MDRFDTLIDGSLNSQNTKSSASPQHSENSFSFLPGVLSDRDSAYSSATWNDDDHTVYFNDRTTGHRPIGYYRIDANSSNKITVCDVFHGGTIGIIDLSYKDGLIFLSRNAVYERWKEKEKFVRKRGLKAKSPIPPISPFGEISNHSNSGYIYDTITGKQIAIYTGNKIGAAAAFICLSSELHTDSKYSKFLSEWAGFESF